MNHVYDNWLDVYPQLSPGDAVYKVVPEGMRVVDPNTEAYDETKEYLIIDWPIDG